jgi:hypothetical protein
VQTATLLVLEPIFESGFEDSSYGFRPDRSALDALAAVGAHVRSGRHEVYDADLQSYFDTIPHDKLMRCVEMRVVDRSVLSLIRMWLDAPVEEEDPGEPGRRRRRRNEAGTPQGGVISPLLANIYLSWLDKLFMSAAGPGTWANARIVRYDGRFRGAGPACRDAHRALAGSAVGGPYGADDQPEEDPHPAGGSGWRDPGLPRLQPALTSTTCMAAITSISRSIRPRSLSSACAPKCTS